MPTYGYECRTCKEQFETVQRITEDALTIHDGCGGELRRLLYPVGIVFKGSGFYVNDYAKSSKKETAGVASGDKAESKPEKATDSRGGGKAETETEAKTEAKSEPKTAVSSPPASIS